MQKVIVLLIVSLLVLSVAACLAPPTVPEAQLEVESAENALCVSVRAYSASVEALTQVSAETTVDEFNALRQAADTAYTAMVNAWGDLQSAEVQAVESAVNDLQESLRNIPGEATLGEVSADIQSSAATVKASVDQLSQTACVEPEQ
jgi:hypothetical protein